MATAEKPRSFDAAETNRRVRHPLDALRGHIRRYVLLEGLATALLFLAICFWAGLALDYGLFKLFAVDWVQELQQLTIDPTTGAQSNIDTMLRGGLLVLFLGGLLAVVVWKVLLRVTREFSDAAVALVLERRFPAELGDRLITAVEIAEPALAEKYGYSKSLVERTIADAAERVEKLPVTEVFDWARLRLLGIWCGVMTVGMYLAVGVLACIYGAVIQGSASPLDYVWGFNDAASIWVERNILLMNSYWPRRAYLEVIRFQDTPEHRGDMRVGRDEQRPDVQIRAIQWVIADHKSPDGWRALRWADLPEFIDEGLLAKVTIPEKWDQWLVDLDDLDPNVPGGLLPTAWQGKTMAEVRADLPNWDDKAIAEVFPEVPTLQLKTNLGKAQGHPAVQKLFTWKSWTIDKIELQERRGDIRRALREQFPQAHKALEEVFGRLAELAESPRYSRTLRRLVIPTEIHVYYRGASTKNDHSREIKADNKYVIGLADLKESVRFTVRGEDYYTPSKKITLVPPPAIKQLTIDKEEPAYIYYRVQGDQAALKGKRQYFHGYGISNMGDASTIKVPFGTSLVLHAKTDRPLQEGVRMRAPVQTDDRAATVPRVPITLNKSGTEFSISLANVVKPYEFVFEFNDRDNVKGRRRIRIQPEDDRPPEVLDVELEVVLRKPRFKADAGRPQGADGFLITPNALLPFKGTLRDDYGLTRAVWLHEAQQVQFELHSPGQAESAAGSSFLLQGSAATRHGALALAFFQLAPGMPSLEVAGPPYWVFMTRLFRADLALNRSEGERAVPMAGFLDALRAKSLDELSATALEEQIAEHAREQKLRYQAQLEEKSYTPKKRWVPRPPMKEYSLKDEVGFDVYGNLPRLKALDPTKDAQLHYTLRLAVEATDNNVETGPSSARNRAPFLFLVVSENELLGQVAIEEEALRDRLEKAAAKLRNGKVAIDEQVAKLSAAGADYSLVSLRVDDVRKSLLDAGTTAREIYNDYRRIFVELKVNQVSKTKLKDVDDKIIGPLSEIVDPNVGNFSTTEAALDKLYAGLDDDLTNKRGDENLQRHAASARAAAAQLDRLLERLNQVLVAMTEGVDQAKLLELLVNIERVQRLISQELTAARDREVLELINDLTRPKEK